MAIESGLDWNRDGRVGPVEGFIGRRSAFSRDVLVNIVANLLAAAVTAFFIYVLGVMLGYFALGGLVYFAVVGAMAVTWIVVITIVDRRAQNASLSKRAVQTLAVGFVPVIPIWLVSWALLPVAGIDGDSAKVLPVTVAAVTVAIGIVGFVMVLRDVKINWDAQRAQKPLPGMSWIPDSIGPRRR